MYKTSPLVFYTRFLETADSPVTQLCWAVYVSVFHTVLPSLAMYSLKHADHLTEVSGNEISFASKWLFCGLYLPGPLLQIRQPLLVRS